MIKKKSPKENAFLFKFVMKVFLIFYIEMVPVEVLAFACKQHRFLNPITFICSNNTTELFYLQVCAFFIDSSMTNHLLYRI